MSATERTTAKAAAEDESVDPGRGAMRLMRKMGSKSFDPIPPDQHAWAMDPDQPPLLRLWGAMCHHTIHWGHRKEYAVDTDGNPLMIENLATILGMDEGNARKYWRQGVERGLWRNGTAAEGKRKLYLRGQVPPYSIELATQKSDCTDLFESYPPYQREAIKALTPERRQEFLAAAGEVTLRGDVVLKDLMAAGRYVINRDHDTLFARFGIPKIRETHKNSAPPEEAAARQKRLDKLVPVIEQIAQTLEHPVQTADLVSTNGDSSPVQSEIAGATLLGSDKTEKSLEGGRTSSNGLPCHEENPPMNERSPANQHPAATERIARSREAKSQAQKQARERKAREEAAEPPPTPDPAPEPDAAMVDELFHQIEKMQVAYPHTDFSADPVNPSNPGDRVTVAKIVRTIDCDVIGFCVYVSAKFKGLDRNALGKLPARSPAHPKGPRSLGLILEWADDYTRSRAYRAGGHPQQPRSPQVHCPECGCTTGVLKDELCGDCYRQKQRAQEQRYSADVQTRHRAQRTLDDPAAPEDKKALARVILGLDNAKGATP